MVCDRFGRISYIFNNQWSNDKWRCKSHAVQHIFVKVYRIWIALFSFSADKRLVFQGGTTCQESIFAWQYLFELLLHFVRPDDSIAHRQVHISIAIRSHPSRSNTKYSLSFHRRGEVTDEFLVEVVAPNNVAGPASQSIVMQPISNNAHIHKTKYYENDVSIDSHSTTSHTHELNILLSSLSVWQQSDHTRQISPT